jgi:hypothetical protein
LPLPEVVVAPAAGYGIAAVVPPPLVYTSVMEPVVCNPTPAQLVTVVNTVPLLAELT